MSIFTDLNLVNSNTNLDVNASYGLLKEVAAAITQLSPSFAFLNPSSTHKGGQLPRYVIEESRDKVRNLLGCSSNDKVIFTSGATEANNSAIFSLLFSGHKNSHIITSQIEHPSILEAVFKLEALGFEITQLAPDSTGNISTDSVLAAIKGNTRMISLMYANNETGVLLPIKEIGQELIRSGFNGYFHVDGVQAVGKMPFNFSELNIDLLSISGHKFGALTGTGALILRNGIEIDPLMYGGPQEKRSRAGTENIYGIFSMGVAADIIKEESELRYQKLSNNREIIWSILRDEIPDITPTVNLNNTIPNTLSVRIKGVNSADLVVALDMAGVSVSSGAACASGKPGASHVLLAMGMTEEEASQCIRISVGADYTDDSELESAAKKIAHSVRRARE